MTNYIALIGKEAGTDYGVTFPDFPGCISAGRTLDEARSMAQEALEGHVACMIEAGEAIPEPSSLEAVMADPDNKDDVAVLISVRTPSKAVRVNITLEENLLSAISDVSRNRSKFLSDAAWEKLNREHAA